MVIMVSVINGTRQRSPWRDRSLERRHATAACIVAGREGRFSVVAVATMGDPLEGNRRGQPAGTHKKKARLVIDLQTSKAVPEAEFGRP
ncbi:hypothetical protein KIP88_10365 [Bradyrhizobium sp. SRL28]|uniref:hypothetical protein n=1 Tax=Bradyrhizobium sp. SRL28 TaxID=2836178 RepID=UPI001BDF1265|nr:hypothetical protein [Bradyrhizobium sp. SRL28]MBT1510907.1 hypothetical protein [Bradyrhizobium sp. SRL28]